MTISAESMTRKSATRLSEKIMPCQDPVRDGDPASIIAL
jgi:hypothetical protein